MGYPVYVNGDFDHGTEQAVKHFQKDIGIDPDGIVGASTYSKIEEVLAYIKDHPVLKGCWSSMKEQERIQ